MLNEWDSYSTCPRAFTMAAKRIESKPFFAEHQVQNHATSYFQMCHMYDWICDWRSSPLLALYAYLPHWVYWRLVNAQLHMPFVYGACGRRPSCHLRNELRILDAACFLNIFYANKNPFLSDAAAQQQQPHFVFMSDSFKNIFSVFSNIHSVLERQRKSKPEAMKITWPWTKTLFLLKHIRSQL